MKNNLKKLLVGGIAASFLLSVPNVVTKINTENSSDTVEIAADYRHIYLSAKKDESLRESSIFETLKKSGVTSIGLTENSLSELQNRELIHVYKGIEFQKHFWNTNIDFPIKKEHTYVVIPKHDRQKEIIQTIINSQIGGVGIYQIGDNAILNIEENYSIVYNKPLLFLESDFKTLSNDFYITPRISNDWEDRLILIKEQLSEWNSQKKLSNVIFGGSEAVGFDEKTEKTNADEFWKEIGVGTIEVFDAKQKQKGLNEYIYESDFNINRVHSIPREKLDKISENDLELMIAKAAKERNIRIFYVNLPFYDLEDTSKEFLKETKEKVSPIADTLKSNGFNLGQAEPFVEDENKMISDLGIFASMFGAMLLFLLALLTIIEKQISNIPNKLFALATLSGATLLFTGIDSGLIKSVVSLGLSILLPVWSALKLVSVLDNHEINKKTMISKILLPISGLYLIGLSYLVSINHSIANVYYVEAFRGVSLTLSIPPLLIAIYVFFKLKNKMALKSLFTHKIRIIDVLLVSLIGAFLLFYESRSGNSGSLLPFEASIRNWLETTLPVRPRSKEVFFAFPLLVLMIGFWKESKWVRLVLPLVAIGFASVFNTFTHFHTPLEYSALRSILSIVVGLFIGSIALAVIKPVYEETKNIIKRYKK